MRVRVLVLLDDELRGREEAGAARMVVMQVREHDHVHLRGLEAEGVETVHEQVFVGEACVGVVAHEPGHRARRHAGVEEDDGVGGAHEITADRDLEGLAGEVAIEEARALEAHEPVLHRIQGLNRHWRGILARPRGQAASAITKAVRTTWTSQPRKHTATARSVLLKSSACRTAMTTATSVQMALMKKTSEARKGMMPTTRS